MATSRCAWRCRGPRPRTTLRTSGSCTPSRARSSIGRFSTGPSAPNAETRRICALASGLNVFAVALYDPNAMDTTPPDVSVTLSPPVITRANNRLVTVTATIAVSDNADPSPAIILVSITSNDGRHDRNQDVRGAAIGTDDRTFSLRAGAGRARPRPHLHHRVSRYRSIGQCHGDRRSRHRAWTALTAMQTCRAQGSGLRVQLELFGADDSRGSRRHEALMPDQRTSSVQA